MSGGWCGQLEAYGSLDSSARIVVHALPQLKDYDRTGLGIGGRTVNRDRTGVVSYKILSG